VWIVQVADNRQNVDPTRRLSTISRPTGSGDGGGYSAEIEGCSRRWPRREPSSGHARAAQADSMWGWREEADCSVA
jgi:hypothetical protein